MNLSPALDSVAVAAPAVAPLTVEDEREESTADLRSRMVLWKKAFRDRDEPAAAALLAADFAQEQVQPVRSVMTRAVWLELLQDYVVEGWDVEEEVLSVDGKVAAVLQRVRVRATVLGEDRGGAFVVTDLWRRSRGRWLLWRRHLSPLLPSSAE